MLFALLSLKAPDPNIFLWIDASVDDDDAVNPNDIKTLLGNGLSAFFINCNSVFSSGPKSLPKNLMKFYAHFMQLSFMKLIILY